MTVEVPKVIGQAVLGTPGDRVVVAKIIGFVIYDPNTPAPGEPHKIVRTRGRLVYTPD